MAGTIHVFKLVSDKYQSLQNPKSYIGMAAEQLYEGNATEYSLAQIRLPEPFEQFSKVKCGFVEFEGARG